MCVASFTTYAYIGERNSRFIGLFYRIIRGELDPSEIIKLHIGPHRCKDTGGSRKIVDGLDSVSGAAYKRSLDSVKTMLREACNAYTKESTATILAAEGEWRYCSQMVIL